MARQRHLRISCDQLTATLVIRAVCQTSASQENKFGRFLPTSAACAKRTSFSLTSTAGAMFHQGRRSPRTSDLRGGLLQQRKSNLEAIVGPRATFDQCGRKTARSLSRPMNLRLCNHIPRLPSAWVSTFLAPKGPRLAQRPPRLAKRRFIAATLGATILRRSRPCRRIARLRQNPTF